MADSVSPDDFKAAMGSFASGVTVVTAIDEDGRKWGLTASAFTSVSLDPPLCQVCIGKKTGSHGAFRPGGTFGVSVLTDQQDGLSNHFASRQEDKFADVDWQPGEVTGSPLLNDALAWIECEVHEILEGGDHSLVLGRIVATTVRDGQPLLFWRGAYGDITSRPKSW